MKKMLNVLLVVFMLVTSFTTRVVAEGTYEITFDGKGGKYGEQETIKVTTKEDGTIGVENWPSNPTRFGYNFSGYKNGEDYNTVFTENTTVEATWLAKETKIILNSDGGLDGDISATATYGNKLPHINVPHKEELDFLGYYDSEENKYYDSNGDSNYVWDKENETFDLTAKYESKVKHTVTINLDGGKLLSNVPDGWTSTDKGYEKQFGEGTIIESILSEFSKARIDKDGFEVNSYLSWNANTLKALKEDVIVTVTYTKAYEISVTTVLHTAVRIYKNKIAEDTPICIHDNKIVNYFNYDIEYVKITPEPGYAVDSWAINGKNVQEDTYYYVGEDIKVTPSMSKYYNLIVDNTKVTENNYGNILKGNYFFDNKVSYDLSNKTLFISGFAEENYASIGLIKSFDDLTIVSTGNIRVQSIECDGVLTIKADNDNKFIVDNYSIESNSAAIKAKKVIFDAGFIDIKGYSYGIKADDIVVNSIHKPIINVRANTRFAINASNSITLNGANVIGASEDYVETTTKQLFQTTHSPIEINYEENVIDYHLTVCDVKVTSLNKDDIKNSDDVSYGSYNPNDHTLSLNENVIFSSEGYGIYSEDDLVIKPVGNTTIYTSCDKDATGNNYGIYCKGDLTILGNNFRNFVVDTNGSGSSYYVNAGIYADGLITIDTNVVVYGDDFRYTDDDRFKISVGIWGRKGIIFTGTENDVLNVRTTVNMIPCGNYNSYGLLAGDGNPGYDDSQIVIDHTMVSTHINDTNVTDNQSCYGIYAYGDINIISGIVEPNVAAADYESINIYSGNIMNILDSELIVSFPYSYNKNLVLGGIEAASKLSIDDSVVTVINANQEYSVAKKVSSIKAGDTLAISGKDTLLRIDTVTTIDGDSIGINAKKKLDIQGGEISVIGSNAVGDSIAIYAGNDSFTGSHSINNAILHLFAEESKEGNSYALRVKKQPITIDGAKIDAYAKTSAIYVSDVLTINESNPLNKTIVTANVAEGKEAIKSKEILDLKNDATVIGNSNEYDLTSTTNFIQSGSDPVKIYYKELVIVYGMQMVYPEGKTSYTYGDEVAFTGIPKAQRVIGGEVLPCTPEQFELAFYKKNGQEYEKCDFSYDAGDYMMTITLSNDNYKGKDEILYTVNKKDLTAEFDEYSFEYDGTAKTPILTLRGLVNDDTYSFGSSNPTYVYSGDYSGAIAPSNTGEYHVNATIDKSKITIDSRDSNVTNNYNIDGLNTDYETTFYIFDEIKTSENINASSYGSTSEITNSKLAPISKEDALVIAGSDQTLIDAINNNDTIEFFTKISNGDKNEFTSKNIDETNAIFFAVDCFYRINDGEKVSITDLNGKKIKVTVTIPADKAQVIVGTNKNYYVYRKHNGEITKLNCSLVKNSDNYEFTFESDLFSEYALISENRPNYDIPKTGVR